MFHRIIQNSRAIKEKLVEPESYVCYQQRQAAYKGDRRKREPDKMTVCQGDHEHVQDHTSEEQIRDLILQGKLDSLQLYQQITNKQTAKIQLLEVGISIQGCYNILSKMPTISHTQKI